ncbi:hypothetical protein GCM10028821_03720 [Hymenobacter jeollabukensis]
MRRRLLASRPVLLGGLLVLLLLPFLALCYFNVPYWDDYGNAALARDLGAWPALKQLYVTWSGRYFSLWMLTALNPLTYGWLGGLPAFSLLVFAATWWVQAFALRVLTRQQLAWPGAAGWSALLLLAQLYIYPSPNSAFYWFASVVVYQLAAILLLLLPIAVLQALRARSGFGRVAWYGLAVGCVLAIAGANELALLLLGWVLAGGCAVCYRQGLRRALRYWAVLLGVAVLAGSVALLAPGNVARMVYEGKAASPGLLRIAWRGLTHSYTLLSEPRLATALAVLPLLLSGVGHRYRHLRPAGLAMPLGRSLSFLLLGLLLLLLLLGRTWSGYPAARTQNFLYFWVLIGWLLALWAAVPTSGPRIWQPLLRRLRWPTAVYVTLIMGGGTERAAWQELRENARAWQQQHQDRHAAILAARRQGVRRLVVEPIRNIRPQQVLILGETLDTQAASDLNKAVAAWYRLDSLRVKHLVLPPADVNLH